MVQAKRLELWTFRTSSGCSNQLSYACKRFRVAKSKRMLRILFRVGFLAETYQ